MMRHEFYLNKDEFQRIYSGDRKIKIKVCDQRKKQVASGDELCFIFKENEHIRMLAKVEALYLSNVPQEQEEMWMEFTIEPWQKPFRDPFRMQSFTEQFVMQLMEYWNRHPDDRFGQILTIFQYAVQQKGYKDLFYIEDDEFLKLWEEVMQGKGDNKQADRGGEKV